MSICGSSRSGEPVEVLQKEFINFLLIHHVKVLLESKSQTILVQHEAIVSDCEELCNIHKVCRPVESMSHMGSCILHKLWFKA